MAEQVNYYKELELDGKLSSEELGKQLKAIIRKWRNRTTAPDQEVRHRAEKIMEMAEEAISILTHSTKKSEYDKKLIEQNRKQTEIVEQNEMKPKPKVNAQAEYERIYEKANHFKDLGDLNETMMLAKQLIDMNLNDWRGWEIAGRAYHDDNNLELAKKYYEKAIQLEKDIPAYVRYNLGISQQDSGKYVEAYRSFQRSLEVFPDYDSSLIKCNDLLEYMNIDSVLPFLEKLKEKRNDSLTYETLIKAYSLKADRLVQEIDGSPIFTSKEQIQEYIELMEKAESYSKKPEIHNKIVKANHALGKEFDKSKIPVLLFPLFSALSILNSGGGFILTIFIFLLSSIVLAVITYASIRPRYEINSWKTEGKGSLYDKVVGKTYIKDSLGWTIVIWFVLITILAPITTILYLILVIYLIFGKDSPQLLQEKVAHIIIKRKKGDQ